MNYFALFSNNFFPGGAGGDIVRSYYIVKYADKQITKGMLSVGVDRILGLLALMTIAVVFFFYEPFSDTQITPLFQTALIITIVAYIVIVGICLSVIYARSIGLVSLYEAIIEKNSSLWKYSRPFYEALRSYKSSPICLLQCLILSFVSQGLTLLIIVIVSVNMELGDISIRQYALAGASGLLANVLPITPGGIGIGESAFDQVCRLLATNAAGSFSVGFLVFRVVSMMFTIPGIFSYIFLFQNRKTS